MSDYFSLNIHHYNKPFEFSRTLKYNIYLKLVDMEKDTHRALNKFDLKKSSTKEVLLTPTCLTAV